LLDFNLSCSTERVLTLFFYAAYEAVSVLLESFFYCTVRLGFSSAGLSPSLIIFLSIYVALETRTFVSISRMMSMISQESILHFITIRFSRFILVRLFLALLRSCILSIPRFSCS